MTKYITTTTPARTYTLETCTAIDLHSIMDGTGEAARQYAIKVSYTADSGELIENLVFGWRMPDDEADLIEMFDDPTAWEPDRETLATVRPCPRMIQVYTSGWRTGSGWDYQNDHLDTWGLDGDLATMDKLPAEAAEWAATALLGDQPDDDDLLAAADDTYTDTEITMELVEQIDRHEYATLDTRSTWRSELAKAILADHGHC